MIHLHHFSTLLSIQEGFRVHYGHTLELAEKGCPAPALREEGRADLQRLGPVCVVRVTLLLLPDALQPPPPA